MSLNGVYNSLSRIILFRRSDWTMVASTYTPTHFILVAWCSYDVHFTCKTNCTRTSHTQLRDSINSTNTKTQSWLLRLRAPLSLLTNLARRPVAKTDLRGSDNTQFQQFHKIKMFFSGFFLFLLPSLHFEKPEPVEHALFIKNVYKT